MLLCLPYSGLVNDLSLPVLLLSFRSLPSTASLSKDISKSLMTSSLKSVDGSSKSRLGVSSSFLAAASSAIFLKFICCKSAGWMLFVFSA